MHDEVQKLRETLAHLHAELGTVESGDPEVRSMLMSALQDISAKLEARGAAGSQNPSGSQDTAGPVDPAAPFEPLPTEQLAETARLFEVEHPTLAATVRSVIDALARAGI